VFAYDPEFHEHLPTQLPHFPGAQDQDPWLARGPRLERNQVITTV
jgi:hypothetical protein